MKQVAQAAWRPMGVFHFDRVIALADNESMKQTYTLRLLAPNLWEWSDQDGRHVTTSRRRLFVGIARKLVPLIKGEAVLTIETPEEG